MGCSPSTVEEARVSTIPDPTGDPVDPLLTKGDIMDAITMDPHIHYFKNEIEKNMMPRRGRRIIKGDKESAIYATTDHAEYQQYIDMLNNSFEGNDDVTTNVMSMLFEEIADVRERNDVKEKLDLQDKYAALKCFVYLYTGDYAYKKVNQSLRKNDYEKMAPVLAAVKNQLGKFAKEDSNQNNEKISVLYRGVSQEDKSMVQGNRLYWKSFTSSSKSKKVAMMFGTCQYTIYLSPRLSHEYIIIPKHLSKYEEEEVLIFPYLYFEVTKSIPKPNNKASEY